MKNYLIGRKVLSFDFGDGETVATYYDGNKSIHCFFDREQRRQKLYSAVFKSENGYSLESGSKLLLNLKKDLLELMASSKDMSSDALREAEENFKGFIRCAMDAVVSYNSGITISECALLFAYPSSFYDAKSGNQETEMRTRYKSLIESVLSEYNPKSLHSIDEAGACFYCKGSSSENCLIIDAGSSTLDFALFVNGYKVELPRISNSTLGASTIETSLYDIFNEGTFASNIIAIDKLYGDGFTRPYLVHALRKKKENAYTREQFLKLGSYELLDDLPNINVKYSTYVFHPFEDSKGNLMDFNLLPEIQCYRNDVKRAIIKAKKIAEKLPEMSEKSINQVILCGGASLMGWLQTDVQEIFKESGITIQHLDGKTSGNDPSFTVSDGLVQYVSIETYQIDGACGFNKDGVLIIKKDGKYGAAEKNGSVLLNCTYESESNIPRRCPVCGSFKTSYNLGEKTWRGVKQVGRAGAAVVATAVTGVFNPNMASGIGKKTWDNLKPVEVNDYKCDDCGHTFN